MPNPPFDPVLLERAALVLRDDSVNTALGAKPQKPMFAGFWSFEKAIRTLAKALAQWAMQPTQEHANAALGCLMVVTEKQDEGTVPEIVTSLCHVIEENHGLMWNQMIFYALNLSKPGWRATAALNLCELYPGKPQEPLAGPRFVSELARDRRLKAEQRGSLIAGALQLADPRTMPFLLTAWKELPAEARYAASLIQPGTAQVPYIEFLLDALNWEPVGDIYGALAGQLGRLASFGGAETPFVTIERAFPSWAGKGGPLLKREIFTKQQIVDRIRDRLIDLKDAEKGDRVMSMVIEVWEDDEASTGDAMESDDADDSGDAGERSFEDLADDVFVVFYSEHRSAQDRLKDSLIGGLLVGLREAGGHDGASRLLSCGCRDDAAFSAKVAATTALAKMVVDSPRFKQLYPPGSDLKHALQSFAQVLHKLITDESPRSRLKEGGTELCQDARHRLGFSQQFPTPLRGRRRVHSIERFDSF